MENPPKIQNEPGRIRLLHKYQILDSLPEQTFDDLAEMASLICGTPIAFISFVDSTRQWFKAAHGADKMNISRQHSFCAHAIAQDSVLVVPDALLDTRFHDNPFVVSENGVRFYAGAPLKGPSGENIGTICALDRKPMALNDGQIKALAALSRQVVQLLELRLKVLELEDAKAEIQAVSEKVNEATLAKSQFLANMSHEIRTPMNGIIGMTELALDAENDADQNYRLQIIRASSQTLLALINDILDFSKIESGKLEIESAAFDIRRSSSDLAELLRPLALKRGVALELNIDASVARFVVGDVTRYKQILSNLICNAVKFTAAGRIDVEICSEAIDEMSKRIVCRVRDTGIGIDTNDIEKLFKSFSQANASTTRRFGGTGLGLSISKSLCLAMGGDIAVTSELGIGSTFKFWIVVKESMDLIMRQEDTLRQSSSANPHDVIKILVAEDNLVNQKVISAFLRKLGYSAVVVANGREAVEIASEQRFDLIFMDCHMPVMDGFDATKAIRTCPNASSDARIVALSASVMKEDQNRCYEVGMNDFLPKPLRLEELSRAIDARTTADTLSPCKLGSTNTAEPRVNVS